MAQATLLFQKTLVEIGSVEIDASIEETHTRQVEVTDSPVEQGSDVTDNLRVKPDTLEIKGVITDYTIDGQNSANVAGRSTNAYGDLLDLAGSNTLITVVTSLRTYENMALLSLKVPRNAKTGQAVEFTATFKEITIVQNQTIAIARTQPSAAANKNLGKQGTPPKPKSLALRTGGAIQNALGTKGGFFQGDR